MSERSRLVANELPYVEVDVVEPGVPCQEGTVRCEIGVNLDFDTEKLESYFFASWDPVLYDALLVAAAVEFCDRTLRRPQLTWARNIKLRIPVHQPDRWKHRLVRQSLQTALDFLTGDKWNVTFNSRRRPAPQPRQGLMQLGQQVVAVVPFSDGLDSQAVAGLLSLELGAQVVRVRLGSKRFDENGLLGRQPFTSVPYRVRAGEKRFVESSARSRGFKFAILSALAAYLCGAGRVILPESGQGALGPALVPVGQVYADYRSHPLFTRLMEHFVQALLTRSISFEFPQLWSTKGETLRRFVQEVEGGADLLRSTQSCWQQNRQASVDHKRRQCGICAACMLRRMSLYAAGVTEDRSAYVWENLSAANFRAGAAKSFARDKITSAMREYAVAGTLHLDHLADLLNSKVNASALRLSISRLSYALGLPVDETDTRLRRMLKQHEIEWSNYTKSLGERSFVWNWVASAA